MAGVVIPITAISNAKKALIGILPTMYFCASVRIDPTVASGKLPIAVRAIEPCSSETVRYSA